MNRNAFYHGTRFGLLLQLAVGPVCLFVFRTASERGVQDGLSAVGGVVLVDALYIALAGLGVTRWADSGRMRSALRYGGAAIVALFGLDILVSAAGFGLIPSPVQLPQDGAASGSFLGAALLTGSNPLTIMFWVGVFSARIAAERYERRDLRLFSAGCIAATVLFMTGVAIAGALVGQMAPDAVLRGLNAAVGCALLYFALRLATQRTAGAADDSV